MSEFLDSDPYVIQIKSLRAKLAAAQTRVGQLEDDVRRRSKLYNELHEECAAAQKDTARYQEQADAIHKYLLAKNDTALLAVITELSLGAQRRMVMKEEK